MSSRDCCINCRYSNMYDQWDVCELDYDGENIRLVRFVDNAFRWVCAAFEPDSEWRSEDE